MPKPDTQARPTDAAAPVQSVLRGAPLGKHTGPAPVHLWNPPFCGDIDMRIATDGTWFYLGTPIGRPALVRLFASVLKLEAGRYYLVTPVEKVGIRVEDAPFVAQDCAITPERLTFTTNMDETVVAGPDHPIRVVLAPDGTPRPYVMVRAGLEALIDRKTFYRVLEAAQPAPLEGQDWLCLRSEGALFGVVPMAELRD